MSKKGVKTGNQSNSKKIIVGGKVADGGLHNDEVPKPLTIIEELLLMIDGSPPSDVTASKKGIFPTYFARTFYLQ